MSKDNIIKLIQPGNVDDQLTEILRNGARALLAQAIEAEVSDFLGKQRTATSASCATVIGGAWAQNVAASTLGKRAYAGLGQRRQREAYSTASFQPHKSRR